MKKQLSLSGKSFLLVGILIGMAVTAAMLLLSAFGLLLLDADRSLAAPLATVSASAGALAAAFYNAWKIGDKGYRVGLLTGGALFLTVLLASAAFTDSTPSLNTLFHLIIMLLAGLIGGIIGVNRRQNKKYI